MTQVELDPEVVHVANTILRQDNGGSMEDPRVHIINTDAFTWLREGGDGTLFDAVIIDLPDPDNSILARLYSEEFYVLARKQLAPEGRLAGTVHIESRRLPERHSVSRACTNIW